MREKNKDNIRGKDQPKNKGKTKTYEYCSSF